MQVPTALAAAEPEARLKLSLKEIGLDDAFQVIVSAEDMSRGSPDPEGYLLAAQQLGRPPMRCVVIGNSNQVCLQPGKLTGAACPWLGCASYHASVLICAHVLLGGLLVCGRCGSSLAYMHMQASLLCTPPAIQGCVLAAGRTGGPRCPGWT